MGIEKHINIKKMGKLPTRNDVIKKYLNNDLERFLKRVYRQSKHELVYSVTLNRYEQEVPGIKKKIFTLFRREFPGNVASVINTHIVLCKYYGFVIDLEDIAMAYRIDYVLFTDIQAYFVQAKRHRRFLELPVRMVSEKKAKAELLARGFICINDWEEFDKEMGHISTNANIRSKFKLYYPMNFSWDHRSRQRVINNGFRWWEFTDVHLAHGVVGITGYTRVSTPINR